MTRLCERPGCSAPAAVAYGMVGDQLLVWLAIVPEGMTTIRVGMLCRRHADAMVVPRGWTLDDRREATPRLFRVTDAQTANHPSRGGVKRRSRIAETGEPPMQFAFDAPDAPDAAASTVLDPLLDEAVVVEPPIDEEVTVGDIRPLAARDPEETQAVPWRPVFDHSDDLRRLLNADSPLLSRAFRGRDAKPPEST